MGTILDSLFPVTRAALLVALFRDPSRRPYLSELIEIIGRGRGVVQRELTNLVSAGIVEREHVGGRVYYRANRACPVFPELAGLVQKTAGFAAVLEEHLAGLDGVQLAFLFGSMARGQETADSDIDLAVVGTATFRDVVRALAPVQSLLSREVNPVVYTAGEMRDRVARGEHFMGELMSTPKRFIIGTQHDLEAVAGKQVAD